MKIIVSGCWLLVLFFFNISLTSAQNTTGSLAIPPNEHIPITALFAQLNQAPIDSQVNILLKISRYYWYERTAKGLDSCYIYSLELRGKSVAQHNITGENEANFMLCKVLLTKDKVPEAVNLSNSIYGEERIRLLMLLGEYFLFKPDVKKENLDKAYSFILPARNLCDSLQSRTWKYPCLLLLGKYYFATGNINSGKQSIMQIIDDCAKSKNTASEAHFWSELGIYMPSTDSTYLDQIHSHQMAVVLFSQIGNKKEAAYSLRDIAELNMAYNHLNVAETQMLQVIATLKSLKEQMTFHTYNVMMTLYSYKGEYKKALDYLLLQKAIIKPDDKGKMTNWNLSMADFYRYLKLPEQSLLFYRQALALDEATISRKWIFYTASKIVALQVSLGQQKQAYSWLKNFTKAYRPAGNNDKMFESISFGEAFNGLKMYPQAEKAYLQMIDNARQVELDYAKTRQTTHQEPLATPYYKIGKFYVERKQYQKAKEYLLQGLNFKHDIDLETKEGIAFQLHEANTGLKDFESALHAYETYTRINDSIANVTKTRQLEELQIKYQTRENEQSIKLLQSAGKYQQAELASSKFQKKAYIAGAGTALLIAGIAFWGYQGKRRSNSKLEGKQIEINRQNGVLQKLLTDKDQLIGDKDSLISEKELLLREIHHRVKNNLQIIISLLNLQSSYLKNDSALEAIHESQGRIRSIALIHQKLYGSTDVTQIGMNEYIPELINYLGDCLGIAKKNIAINYSIQPVNLDISQAVPIGLIINEAITNSTKYAFGNSDKGEIFVSMTDTGTGEIGLSIADNGKGLALEIDVDHIKTMGLSLIKGLVDQLDGSCEFITNSGFVINLKFIKDAFFANNPEHDEAVLA